MLFNKGIADIKFLDKISESRTFVCNSWIKTVFHTLHNAQLCLCSMKFHAPNVSGCNIYAVQQDTQSVLMSEFIRHVC